MASVEAYDGLKAHLVTANTPLQVIDYDNIDRALEQGNTDFLCLQEIETLETQIAMGEQAVLCLREVSGFVVHAFVPSPESSAKARQLGEQVYTDLRFRNINRMRVVDVSPPELEIMNDGLWTASGVTVILELDRQVPRP